MDKTLDQQLSTAFKELCRIAGYYAKTTPNSVKPDLQDDIKYLHVWPGHVKEFEKQLDRKAKNEFRLQTRTIRPLVDQLWKALNKAQKCNRKINWDKFIDHMADVRGCSWELLDALDCN